jgi:stearoyl-CoA desaturase (Delta-9 desaturase)
MTIAPERTAPDTTQGGASVDTATVDPPAALLYATTPGGMLQRAVVSALVLTPLAGGVFALVEFWSHGIGWFDLGLAIAMYIVTGFGITIGYHRLLTHGSFRPRRWLKILLAAAGSMAFEGSAISWTSLHRRHHVYSDRPGDPHSPFRAGNRLTDRFGGLWHAHAGWLFQRNRVDAQRWSPDLLADKDVAFISSTAPAWMVVSLVIPFGLGWAVTRSLWGAFLAVLWGGLVRVVLLHHVTWSINSICHIFGRQPFRTKDQSRNVRLLALVSLGESWHNSHHAFPALASHGVDRWQLDPSASAIALFERLKWASDVRWPRPELLNRRRVGVAPAHAAGNGLPAR